MFLSVIIPTRNRANLIEILLKSIINQTYPQNNFEVIIVDNGSTDRTKSVVESYKRDLPNLTYVYEPTPGLHVGRHAGLAISNGEILVYADDDIEAIPTWLEGIAESFKDPSVVFVGGNNLPRFDSPPPEWFEQLWENTPWGKIHRIFSLLNFGNDIKEISPYYVFGCNFSIRKNVLLEVGGFHPDGMPDELIRYRGDGETSVSEAISKRGLKTIFNPKASVYHWVPSNRMTFDYIQKMGFNQGISDSYKKIRKTRNLSFKDNFKSQIKYLKFLLIKKGNAILSRSTQPYDQYMFGWWKGYLFHHNEVRQDKALFKWITQKNYLNENGNINM
jgi:glycosyltransferase involved in cell wall biosynthesis